MTEENVTEAPKTVNLAQALRGTVQLILAGQFPGNHSQMVCESANLLEAMARNEEKAQEKPASMEELLSKQLKERTALEDRHSAEVITFEGDVLAKLKIKKPKLVVKKKAKARRK